MLHKPPVRLHEWLATALVFCRGFPSPRWTCLNRLSELHLPRFGNRVFLLLGTVCPRRLLYPVLPSWPFSRASPYPQPGDAGGGRGAPASQCDTLVTENHHQFITLTAHRRCTGLAGAPVMWVVCIAQDRTPPICGAWCKFKDVWHQDHLFSRATKGGRQISES